MASTGRNERCPCGSGRKFKQCCLRAQGDEDSARLRLRAAEGFVIPALFDLAVAAFETEFVLEAWDEFCLWPDEPVSLEDSPEFGTTFDPFFAFSFVPDDTERDLPAGWPSTPLALHVLGVAADTIPSAHREFMRQACRSPASFFSVEAVTPGRAIDVRDVMTGRRFHVLEESASRTFRPGDLTYARVLTLDGSSILLGASPWVIPARWHIHLIDQRDHWRPDGRLTREELNDYAIELRELYHEIIDDLQHPRLPEFTNTDGDPLEPTTLTYRLSVPAGEAIERLLPLATLGDHHHVTDDVVDAGGQRESATLSWMKARTRKSPALDNTVLGTIRVEGEGLVADVNSARRARRIQRHITRLLGADAMLIEKTTRDIGEMLAAAQAAADTAPAGAQSPELREAETEIMREYMRAWVDTKVPALGNRTPRQAAATDGGRERLEALLAGMADATPACRRWTSPNCAARSAWAERASHQSACLDI